MFLILLVYLAAFTLEIIGSYVSIVGLAAKTGPILIALAITLDFSKIIIASVLYKQWHSLNWILKTIFLPVCLILVIVTSAGAYAYILKEFGNITNVSEQQGVVLSINEEDKLKLEGRKKVIEDQIAQLPSNFVRQRANLMTIYEPELNEINSKLDVINQQIKEAKMARYDSNNESTNSTIASLSKVYDLPPDQVNRLLALFITFMIDPLAIALLTLANFLSEQRKKKLITDQENDYVLKTKNEKLKELMFGKISTSNVMPEVIVSLKDLSSLKTPKIIIPQYSFIKSYKLIEKPIMRPDKVQLYSGSFLQEISIKEPTSEKLSIINFIQSCELIKDDNSLFQEVNLPIKKITEFQTLFDESLQNNSSDFFHENNFFSTINAFPSMIHSLEAQSSGKLLLEDAPQSFDLSMLKSQDFFTSKKTTKPSVKSVENMPHYSEDVFFANNDSVIQLYNRSREDLLNDYLLRDNDSENLWIEDEQILLDYESDFRFFYENKNIK